MRPARGDGGGGGGPGDRDRRNRWMVVPSPSSPVELWPQHLAVPLVRSAHVWLAGGDGGGGGDPGDRNRGERSVSVPSPSCPWIALAPAFGGAVSKHGAGVPAPAVMAVAVVIPLAADRGGGVVRGAVAELPRIRSRPSSRRCRWRAGRTCASSRRRWPRRS